MKARDLQSVQLRTIQRSVSKIENDLERLLSPAGVAEWALLSHSEREGRRARLGEALDGILAAVSALDGPPAALLKRAQRMETLRERLRFVEV